MRSRAGAMRSSGARHSRPTVLAAFGLGGAAGVLGSRLDRRRRHVAADKMAATGRHAARGTARRANFAAGIMKGAAHAATSPLRGEREYDDVTLARKVESELFRSADAPKGSVSVSATDGVVELRGKVDDPDQVEALAAAARDIAGVKGVRNLLHSGERV